MISITKQKPEKLLYIPLLYN